MNYFGFLSILHPLRRNVRRMESGFVTISNRGLYYLVNYFGFFSILHPGDTMFDRLHLDFRRFLIADLAIWWIISDFPRFCILETQCWTDWIWICDDFWWRTLLFGELFRIFLDSACFRRNVGRIAFGFARISNGGLYYSVNYFGFFSILHPWDAMLDGWNLDFRRFLIVDFAIWWIISVFLGLCDLEMP